MDFVKSNLILVIAAAIDVLSDISLFCQKAAVPVKRQLLGSIFPEYLFFPKKKVEPVVSIKLFA